MPPAGAVSVKVTVAPGAGLPAFDTDAVIGTVLRSGKPEPETEVLTTNAGGIITVTLAFPVPAWLLSLALAFTGYVPGELPEGPPLYIATVTD